MSDEVRSAVFGNVGTMVTFRVGAFDAEVLEKEFAPVFTAEDLVNLGFTQIYLKLMIDGIGSHPFSATTLPPIAPPENSLREEVIESSRERFSHPKKEVEDIIKEWYKPVVFPQKSDIQKTPEASQVNEKKRLPRSTGSNTQKQFQPKELSHKEDDTAPAKKSRPDAPIQKTKIQKPISLNMLKANIPKRPQYNGVDDKGPTPEKMKSLREALSVAMTEKSITDKSNNNNNKHSSDFDGLQRGKPKFSTPIKIKKETNQFVKTQTESKTTEIPKEVPEQTLKKILEE